MHPVQTAYLSVCGIRIHPSMTTGNIQIQERYKHLFTCIHIRTYTQTSLFAGMENTLPTSLSNAQA